LTIDAIRFLFDNGYCGRVDFVAALATVDHNTLKTSQVNLATKLLGIALTSDLRTVFFATHQMILK
jgi:hypothetical protein